MSDKMGFHFFELPKLPEEISSKDELLLWLALFNAETEEELEKIKALEVPEMEQAMSALKIPFAEQSKYREPLQRQQLKKR